MPFALPLRPALRVEGKRGEERAHADEEDKLRGEEDREGLADSLAGEAEEHLGVVVVVAVPRGRRGSPRGEALKRLVRVRQSPRRADPATRRGRDRPRAERTGRRPGGEGGHGPSRCGHRAFRGGGGASPSYDSRGGGRPAHRRRHRGRLLLPDDVESKSPRAPDAALGQTLRRPRNDPRRVLDRTRIRFSPVAADAPARVRPPRASNLAVRLRHPEQDSVSLLSAHFSSRARPEDSRFPFATVCLTVRGLESIPSQPRSALARIVSRHPRRAGHAARPKRRRGEAPRVPARLPSPAIRGVAHPLRRGRSLPLHAHLVPHGQHTPAPHRRDIRPETPAGTKTRRRPRPPRPRVPGNLHVPGDVRSHPRVNRVPGVRIRDDVEEHAEGETPAPAPASGPTPSPSLAAARLGTPRETPRVRRVARRRPHPARRWRRIERTVEPPRVACHPRESRSRRRSPRRRVRGRRPRR